MPETLLSVPPQLASFLNSPEGARAWMDRLSQVHPGGVFVGTDPAQKRLGSGGGTVNLLHQAWLATERRLTLEEWLDSTQKLVLHAGGESRRLPAYAALSKAFLPLPALERLQPRRFDQVLYDFQIPNYQQVLEESGGTAKVLVAAGDVWLDFNPLDLAPCSGDIVGIGMRVSPEVAQHFGVFFTRRGGRQALAREHPISFFLQKPTPAEINRKAVHHDFFVDTGMWLLSVRALKLLFARCGWDSRRQKFATKDGLPDQLDLYTEIGTALGDEASLTPTLKKLGFSGLKSAVVPLGEARFYHLGSSRQLFESMEQLQQGSLRLSKQHRVASSTEVSAPTGASLWLDGVCAAKLELGGNNLVTGVGAADGLVRLGAGQCLEVIPVAGGRAFRPYHIDDPFRGPARAGGLICGRPAAQWLEARGLEAGDTDVYRIPLYPIVGDKISGQALLDWFFADRPDAGTTALLRSLPLLSAEQIPARVDFARLFAARAAAHEQTLLADFRACLEQGDSRVMEQDFSAVASVCTTGGRRLSRWLQANAEALLKGLPEAVHRARLRMLLAELSRGRRRAAHEQAAYSELQTSIVESNPASKAAPRLALKEDQIVWSRSPVRLDLAGGWTDTPPYCLEQGGAVLNVAVLLNGQPPIQVFVRPLREPLFRLRSIDLGIEETIRTQAELDTFRDPRSGFSLAKAALALAGFHPDFCAGKRHRSLADQLRSFGGGLEISLLSAVPKGSGLGTSSILGATLLGALNRACGLGWDEVLLYNRVMSIEQLLTTGGGWQDQAGALFRSVKLIETQRGLSQTPTVRYLPEHLLGVGHANQTLLLYYTGATRLAKSILKEIVRDMFLARADTFRILGGIRANAHRLHQALQEGSVEDLHRAVNRSWKLNKRLDPGTTTAEVETILARCGEDLAACKLLGAGGGGYMFMCARDVEAAQRIRARLEAQPTNPRARFIDFHVAERSLAVTVS
jgi:galactokinase/mevalonate kinase-like predicted kinase